MMRIALALLVLALLLPAAAHAQTATPTPPPAFGFEPLAFEPVRSPTPIPTSEPIDLVATHGADLPFNDAINYLATANANVEDAPEDLTNPGVAVLPQENGNQIFSYAKWLISPTAANEVFGPFGTLAVHLGAAIALVIFLAIVYFLIFVISLLIRFVIWIIKRILDAIEAIPFIG